MSKLSTKPVIDTTIKAGTDKDRRAIVLLVDDQPIIGEGIRRMLENEKNIDFYYCEDPTEALQTAINVKATIILQDLVMPDVDGLTLMRFYKNHPKTKNIPVIVLSSKNDVKMKSNAFSSGANDYLVKLPDPIELIARIHAHTNHYLTETERDTAYKIMQDIQQQLEIRNKELQRLSSLDGLTGVSNRRIFDEEIEKTWNLSRRSKTKTTVSLLILDIDYFKLYNDGYGHQKGDDCLKQVAQTLNNCITRSCDLFARYGGEEFVALLPETNLEGAKKIAKKMHTAINKCAIQHKFSKVSDIDTVTLSFGVATMVATKDNTPEQLIETADKALYKAKENGRNQIMSNDK